MQDKELSASLYVPAAHGVHDSASPPFSPAGHQSHAGAPGLGATLCVPHGVHMLAPSLPEYLPTAQSSQRRSLGLTWYFPAAHLVHVAEPSTELSPGGQNWHSVHATSEYLPATQTTHALSCAYFPAAHPVHDDAPAAETYPVFLERSPDPLEPSASIANKSHSLHPVTLSPFS